MEPTYICPLYVATAGKLGPNLGSDEKEIVLLMYILIELQRNEVVGWMQERISPYRLPRGNETVLSEQVLKETGLKEKLACSGLVLSEAIANFDELIKKFGVAPSSRTLHFVTDGQLPLRQCLYPEAEWKHIELPYYYGSFHDLRKEFKALYGVRNEPQSIREMITQLEVTQTTKFKSKYFGREVSNMVTIVRRLIADGHRFTSPEAIKLGPELGIYLRNDEVDDSCIVKLKGLPWLCSPQEVVSFFRGLHIAKGGVAMSHNFQGLKKGIAFVKFENKQHRDMALCRHMHLFGSRRIKVHKASGKDFITHAAGSNAEAQKFLSRGGQVLLKLRGLPYKYTAKQVLEFLETGENSCKVMNGEEGVLLVKRFDGKSARVAFVLFAQEEEATKAFSKHNTVIGRDCVELFLSTPEDLQYVLNAYTYPKNDVGKELQTARTKQVPLFGYVGRLEATKDAILLRGIPLRMCTGALLGFLGSHARNALRRGIKFFYSGSVHSKEAVVQMSSERSAIMAAQALDLQFIVIGVDYWYIRVYPCSRVNIDPTYSLLK